MYDRHTTAIKRLNSLLAQVEKVTGETGGPDVGEFLANLMMGRDPRPMNSWLYDMVSRIYMREFETGVNLPTQDEWNAICDRVMNTDDYRRPAVDLESSQMAANKLMEYLHAKMKAHEIDSNMDINMKIEPLTGDDLEAFREWMEDEL